MQCVERRIVRQVILLVRMWVEKVMVAVQVGMWWSSSLWGCELKKLWWTRTKTGKCHPPCEDVSWKILCHCGFYKLRVILLVRMWVEKYCVIADFTNLGSSSLWGCELKSWFYLLNCFPFRHPPCEDVSWKSSSKLWIPMEASHPPCEDVSWKMLFALMSNGP